MMLSRMLKHLKKRGCVISLFTCLWVLGGTEKAYAYLDPGNGSFMLQLLLAALFAGSFIIKASLNQIKKFFTSLIDKVKGCERRSSK